MKNTSREQDVLIDRAIQSVDYVVGNLIDTIQSLDEQLSESIVENETLRATIESLEQRIEGYRYADAMLAERAKTKGGAS